MKNGSDHFLLKKMLEHPWLFWVPVSLLLRLAAALRPLAIIDSLPLPDDAYISLGLARNIARGLGPLFGGDLTNGFQPLYVFLMVPVFRIFPDHFILPVHIALVLLAIFDTLALFLLLRLLEKLKKSSLSISLVAVSWAFSFYRLQMAVNGLETVIACFFIIASFSYYVKIRDEAGEGLNPRPFFLLGILLGLAALARIDNLVLAPVMAVALTARQRRRNVSLARGCKNMAWLVAGGALAYLPWPIYSFFYTGQVFPVSGKAVRLISTGNLKHHAPFLREALDEIFANNLLLLAGMIILLAAWFALSAVRRQACPFVELHGRIKNYHVLLAFCALLTGAYAFYVYGFWAFFRYLYPVSVLLLLYAGEVCDLCLESIRKVWQKKVLFSSLLALLLLGNAADSRLRYLLSAKEPSHSGYMDLGLWARDNFAAGTKLGSGQSGALEYFADKLQVINLDGVVNSSSYRALKEKRFMSYAREIGLQYILGWNSEFRFFKRFSEGYREGELVMVKQIREFHFWDQRRWNVYRVNPALAPQPKVPDKEG